MSRLVTFAQTVGFDFNLMTKCTAKLCTDRGFSGIILNSLVEMDLNYLQNAS